MSMYMQPKPQVNISKGLVQPLKETKSLKKLAFNRTQDSFLQSSNSQKSISASGSGTLSQIGNLSTSFGGTGRGHRTINNNISGQESDKTIKKVSEQMSQSFSIGHSRSYYEIFQIQKINKRMLKQVKKKRMGV